MPNLVVSEKPFSITESVILRSVTTPAFCGLVISYLFYSLPRGSAVGRGRGCRMHPISGLWFGSPHLKPNQAFSSPPSGITQLVPGMSVKDKTLTWQSANC